MPVARGLLRLSSIATITSLCFPLGSFVFAADKKAPEPSFYGPQPTTEAIDLTM